MSVRFDAPNDRITWTGTAPTPSSGLTIAFWAYVSIDLNANATYLRFHTSSGSSTVATFATNTDGTTPSLFTVGGSVIGPASAAAGTWARIAYTVTGTTGKVYIALGDTGPTQSATGTLGSSASTTPLSGYTVGGRSISDSSEHFDGRIAYLRIWSTVLTQSEIEAEWISATPVRASLLFAAYPLTSSSDLLDYSGNGRHLSAGSSPTSTEDDPPLPAAITGTIAATFPALETTLAGDVTVDATLAAELPAIEAVASGGLVVDGTLAAELPGLATIVSGGLSIGGELVAILPPLAGTLAGAVQVEGQLAADLPAIEADLDGVLGTGPGTLIAALPALSANLAGSVTVGGDLDAILPALEASLAGPVPATVDVDLPALSVALSGDVSTPILGTLAVTLPAIALASAPDVLTWPPAVDLSEAVEWLAVT